MLEKEYFCKSLKTIEEFNEKIDKGVKAFSDFIKNPNHAPFCEFQYKLTNSFEELIAMSVDKERYEAILEDIHYYYEGKTQQSGFGIVEYNKKKYELKTLEDLYDFIIDVYVRKN